MLVVSCFETECPIKSLLLRIRFVLRKSWIVCVHNLLRHLASDKMLQCNFIFSICGWEIKSSRVLMVSTFRCFFVIVWIARVQFLCVWLTNCYDLKCISGWITRISILSMKQYQYCQRRNYNYQREVELLCINKIQRKKQVYGQNRSLMQ